MTIEHRPNTHPPVDNDDHVHIVEVEPEGGSIKDPGPARVINEQTTYVDGQVHHTAVERSQVVVRSDEDLAVMRLRTTRRAIYFFVNTLTIFMLIRLVLMLTGANPDNGFAQFIYGLTGIFLAPFNTLFGPDTVPLYGTSVFEPAVLVAIGIYYLFAWIGVQIAKISLRRNLEKRVARRATPTVRR